MAIIANLNPEQQTELENILNGYKVTNPDLLFKFFGHESLKDRQLRLHQENLSAKESDSKTSELESKVDALNRKLDFR